MIGWLRGERGQAAGDPVLDLARGPLPITIRRHPRATRLTMRLAPDGSELRMTMPRWGRTADALAFARSRAEWVEAQLARVPPALDIAPGARLPFRGRCVEIAWQKSAPRRPVVDGGTLLVGGPPDNLAQRIRRWMEGEALAHLATDLAHYCMRAGQPLPELRLSRAQRRWGSCSSGRGRVGKRCIRINWRLIMAPDSVRRSVVAHEVAHLAHFDHSPAFYAMLDSLFDGDLEEADRWLKREGRGLYAPFG
ncbi:SprT family zinc-dependent metalloprotease [Altererythrobacter lauratis]|uniref:M48 family metallopeptidase n=1 Tax=Alteraurantiacibacter lauratis TaxID=2054627 RepID=A0ABV7EGR1_9SPHN